jgi:hypothetical protein
MRKILAIFLAITGMILLGMIAFLASPKQTVFAQAGIVCDDDNTGSTPTPDNAPHFTSDAATKPAGQRTYISNGSQVDTQNAVKAATDGDTVIIGADPGASGQSHYRWYNQGGPTSRPLCVAVGGVFTSVPDQGKNIKLKGWGMKKTKISKCHNKNTSSGYSQQWGLINYTTNNTSAVTAEISDMELNGENGYGNGQYNYNLVVVGTAIPRQNGSGAWENGIKIHDVNFSALPSPRPAAGNGEIQVGHYSIEGVNYGVMYHCEISEWLPSLAHAGAAVNTGNYPSGPSLNGLNDHGQYATSLPQLNVGDPVKELAGTKDMFYIEDCIMHRQQGFTNTIYEGGGGANVCIRHNTSWGFPAGHGTRESGHYMRGSRLQEEYNNIPAFNYVIPNSSALGYGGTEERDGDRYYAIITLRWSDLLG